MTLDSLKLAALRSLVQANELVQAYWYLLIPAVLAVAVAALLRHRFWPGNTFAARWEGLLVEVAEQRDLIVLIHAARQDPAFRQDVLHLLDMPVEARLALIEDTIVTMRAQGASEGFVEAIGLLRDEHVVEETRKLLTGLD